jgi:hypothetical protein
VWSSHARRKRLAAGAALVLHIHVQQIQQGNRLGIYVFFLSPPTRRPRKRLARVSSPHCNGCSLCASGCFFVKLLYTSNLFVLIDPCGDGNRGNFQHNLFLFSHVLLLI